MRAVNPSTSLALSQRLHAALPQTQCTRCGYPDCAAYAHAIASGEAAINQCPPGGAEGIERLARITGLPVLPLNPDHGAEAPRALAVIDEAWCIGCTLCIKACPTDAILGSNKQMHTVIEPHCTGCALCLPVCPVDCIALENVTGTRTGWRAWSQFEADKALARYELHSMRRNQDADSPAKMLENDDRPDAPAEAAVAPAPSASQPWAVQAEASPDAAQRRRAAIEAALAKARAQRAPPP